MDRWNCKEKETRNLFKVSTFGGDDDFDLNVRLRSSVSPPFSSRAERMTTISQPTKNSEFGRGFHALQRL